MEVMGASALGDPEERGRGHDHRGHNEPSNDDADGVHVGETVPPTRPDSADFRSEEPAGFSVGRSAAIRAVATVPLTVRIQTAANPPAPPNAKEPSTTSDR